MTDPSGILANFKVHNPLRLILYVSTLIFIGSLFIPIKGYDLSMVQHKSLLIMILGVCSWLIVNLLGEMWERMYATHRGSHSIGLNFVIAFYYIFYISYIAVTVIIIAN
jgi:hypothetical protein